MRQHPAPAIVPRCARLCQVVTKGIAHSVAHSRPQPYPLPAVATGPQHQRQQQGMLIRMNDAEDLLRRAMSLPAEARAALAGSLLRSLESAVDTDAEAAWSAEIHRRLTDLDAGRVNAVDLDEARRRISG